MVTQNYKRNMGLKSILEELQAHPFQYFEEDRMLAIEQATVYHGLGGWDSYKYKMIFSDMVKYIYIKIQRNVSNDTDPAKLSQFQQTISASYQNLQYLYEKFQAFPGYSVIKPIACFPEYFAWISEENHGTDVWTIIRKKAKFYPSEKDMNLLKTYCYKCGRWLALFQQITRRPELDPFKFNQMIELLDTYLSRLVQRQYDTFPDKFRKMIIEYCQQIISLIPEEDRIVSGNHGDFCPGNILIHNDEIIVLDIEPAEYGTIYRDSTYFYHYLNSLLELPIYRPTIVTQLQKAFVQGFGISLDASEKKMITLYMIQNIIQSLLYLAFDRQDISRYNKLPWYNKLYDKILFKKYVHWLQKECRRREIC